MEEIKQLKEIVKTLREKYGKKFTLDGNLVGDIGEVLVEKAYGIKPYNPNKHTHDGKEIATGKKVQIKSSFVGACYISLTHNIPDYLLCVTINDKGEPEELYNGSFKFLIDNYKNDKTGEPIKGNARGFATLSGNKLKKINQRVPKDQKIKKIDGR